MLADVRVLAAITSPSLLKAAQAWDSLVVQLRQAGLQSSMPGVADSFARAYSHMVLSMGVNALTPAPASRESTQVLRQITRMPKAPFIVLIILNCLYALLGLALAIVALRSRPRLVKPVQARLSLMGLVAALFEGERANQHVTKMSKLFEENSEEPRGHKVAVLPTEQGGWKFQKL